MTTRPSGPALPVLLCCAALLAGCNATRTFDLTLTTPEGAVSRHSLSDESGFLFDGQSRATVSWPDLGEWNTKVPVGVSMQIAPLQAGRYSTSGNLHLGDGTVATAKSITWDVTMERVRWQNDGAFPFRMEGSAEGTTPEGYTLSGRFSASTDDCSDKVRANGSSFLCGGAFPSAAYAEQRWTIGRWIVTGDCPAALLARYSAGDGATLVLSNRAASAGGEKSLQCVVTYANAYKVLCGASEENLQLDGCAWGVTALALPGFVSAYQPTMAVIAGTTGSGCAPRFCSLAAADFTHVSGAQATP